MFCLPFHLMATVSHCTQTLPDSASLAGQQTPGILLSPSPHRGYLGLQSQTLLYGCWGLSSGSQVYAAFYSLSHFLSPAFILCSLGHRCV